MSATGAVEVAARPRADRTRLVSWLFLVLIAILSVELLFCIRRESQTWDEACHIFAGYSYWTRGDFGMNPEHPPLVKLLTTLPLLGLNLRVPEHPKFFSKEEDFTTGTDFLYKNNAEQILDTDDGGVSDRAACVGLILRSQENVRDRRCADRLIVAGD